MGNYFDVFFFYLVGESTEKRHLDISHGTITMDGFPKAKMSIYF